MKKVTTIFVLTAILMTSAPLFAADSKDAANSAAPAVKAPKKTVFNALSDYFSMFDKPFTRKDNKQGFWDATADWMRNIDKQ